jgi:hypothetical protein
MGTFLRCYFEVFCSILVKVFLGRNNWVGRIASAGELSASDKNFGKFSDIGLNQ